jgi:hypothetical protein
MEVNGSQWKKKKAEAWLLRRFIGTAFLLSFFWIFLPPPISLFVTYFTVWIDINYGAVLEYLDEWSLPFQD